MVVSEFSFVLTGCRLQTNAATRLGGERYDLLLLLGFAVEPSGSEERRVARELGVRWRAVAWRLCGACGTACDRVCSGE